MSDSQQSDTTDLTGLRSLYDAKLPVVHTLPVIVEALKKEEYPEMNMDREGITGNIHIAKRARPIFSTETGLNRLYSFVQLPNHSFLLSIASFQVHVVHLHTCGYYHSMLTSAAKQRRIPVDKDEGQPESSSTNPEVKEACQFSPAMLRS